MNKLYKLFFLFLLVFTFLSTSVFATSTCDYPLTEYYECSNPVQIGINYGETQSSCHTKCELEDTACCWWYDSFNNCYIGTAIVEGNGFASNCTIDDDEYPSVNIYGEFDTTRFTTKLGTTFLFGNVIENVTTYWKLDDVKISASEQNWTYIPPTNSQYTYYNLTNLEPATFYEYTICLEYINDSSTITQCEVNKNFTTNEIPYVNIYNAFDTTQHNTSLGATWYYSDDFLNETITTYWVLDGLKITESELNWTSEDEFDLSEYDVYFLEGLNPETTYDYYYCLEYYDDELEDDVLQCEDEKSFTTLDGTPPVINIFGEFDMTQTKLTMGTTFLYEDYSEIELNYWVDDDLVYAHTYYQNLSDEFDKTEYVTYNVTGLTENTEYVLWVDLIYGGDDLHWVSDDKTITTKSFPIVTLLPETLIHKEDATINFNIDFNGIEYIEYKIWNNDWVEATNGSNSWLWEDLDAQTTYVYYVEFRGTDSDDFISETSTFTTYYENAFDDVWNTLLQGNTNGKYLIGFFVVLAIVFLAVGLFGHYGISLNMVGILILIIIGSIIAFLMKTFPLYLLLLIIGGSVVLMFLKNMFVGGNYER